MFEKLHPKVLEKKANREKILRALIDGDKSWKELLEITKLPKSVLASHIKELVAEGLITERIDPKDRRKKIYSIRIELLPTSILIDALSLVILRELSVEIMELSISGAKEAVLKKIGEYYAAFSLDDRGRKAILKALDYLGIGWDYMLETCLDEKIMKEIERKILKGDKKIILQNAVNTLVEIYESVHIYRWIANNPEKFQDIASKEGAKEEEIKRILNLAGELAKRYEKILNALEKEHQVFGGLVLSRLKERYKLNEERIIKHIREVLLPLIKSK